MTIGDGWYFNLPSTKHDLEELAVFYYKVGLGKASEFIAYDKETLILQINPGETVERHVGAYPILM